MNKEIDRLALEIECLLNESENIGRRIESIRLSLAIDALRSIHSIAGKPELVNPYLLLVGRIAQDTLNIIEGEKECLSKNTAT